MSFSLEDWREINFESWSWSWEEIKTYYNSDPDNLYKLLNKKAYMRLWEHECGKLFIIYDTGRASKVQGNKVGDKRSEYG